MVSAKLDQTLLQQINSQLQALGLQVQGSTGAVLDATIITSAARPRQHIETQADQAQVIHSADTDARWVKKGQEAYFGYRGYAVVDSEDGYVQHVQMHPANEAEVNKLPEIIDTLPTKPQAVLADKGYASQSNREHLKEQQIGDLIQHKAARGTPLHPLYKAFNKDIGKLRFKVEQAFGTMKRQFHLNRARYFGTAKTQAQMVWAALGMNLLKAHNKLKQIQMQQGVSTP